MWRNFRRGIVSVGPPPVAFAFDIAKGNIVRGIRCRNRPTLPTRGGGSVPIIMVLPVVVPEARRGDVFPKIDNFVVAPLLVPRKARAPCRQSDSPIFVSDLKCKRVRIY
jgi:hypothetical protein